MSKDECLAYLLTHPGKHPLTKIAKGADNNLDSARRFMRRLKDDGKVRPYVVSNPNGRGGSSVLWEAV